MLTLSISDTVLLITNETFGLVGDVTVLGRRKQLFRMGMDGRTVGRRWIQKFCTARTNGRSFAKAVDKVGRVGVHAALPARSKAMVL